jgi:RNA polymerase sigma-70 factor (ECF subfamily)
LRDHPPDKREDPDRLLVGAAKGGDYDAFNALVRRHEARLWRIALRLTGRDEDAREALQEAFFAAIKSLDGFREDALFSTWITTILTREAIRVSKKRVARHARLDDSGDVDNTLDASLIPASPSPWSLSPEDVLSRKETSEAIGDALETLDPKYRQVFIMRDIEGLSIEETASATGLTPANIKVRLMRARLMLRNKLAPLFGEQASGGHS